MTKSHQELCEKLEQEKAKFFQNGGRITFVDTIIRKPEGKRKTSKPIVYSDKANQRKIVNK